MFKYAHEVFKDKVVKQTPKPVFRIFSFPQPERKETASDQCMKEHKREVVCLLQANSLKLLLSSKQGKETPLPPPRFSDTNECSCTVAALRESHRTDDDADNSSENRVYSDVLVFLFHICLLVKHRRKKLFFSLKDKSSRLKFETGIVLLRLLFFFSFYSG